MLGPYIPHERPTPEAQRATAKAVFCKCEEVLAIIESLPYQRQEEILDLCKSISKNTHSALFEINLSIRQAEQKEVVFEDFAKTRENETEALLKQAKKMMVEAYEEVQAKKEERLKKEIR